jgi:hypothetical protein
MVDFSALKRSSNFENLSSALKSLNTPVKYNEDEDKYWKPELDKSGNAFAIIRFLPAPAVDGDSALPFISYFDHGFKGPGGWYIEKSLTTLNLPDPVSECNRELWNSGVPSNIEQARLQKRRLHYVSNIYVIKDSKHPENEGKIFLFSYGKKIMEKIDSCIHPQFEDETKFDPFNFWTGANFKLKVRKVDGYQNYDLSEFEAPSPLLDDDEKIKEVWENEYSLKSIVSPDKFKSYEELKSRLNTVLGISLRPSENFTAQSVTKSNIKKEEKVYDVLSVDDDDSENLDFFASLVEDDDV